MQSLFSNRFASTQRRQCEGDGTDTNVCSGVPAETYVETIATDNWGHATSEHRGPVVTSRTYDVFNGCLLATCSGTAGVICGLPSCSMNCPLQDETYTWDAKGNLLTRSRSTTYTERFAYDANDRVTLGWYSVLNGISYPITPPANPATDVNVTEWMSYDPLGNICQRTGTDGTTKAYTYAKLGGCGLGGLPGGVNAGSTANSGYQLLAAGSENFATDANGSMTVSTNSGGTVLRGWNYDTQNRAVEVYKGATPASASIRTRWDYDADGARFRRTDDGTNGPNDTTLYLDNVERTTTGVSITWRRTIAGVAVMALVGTNPVLPTTNFLLHDHIGSIVAVANVNGALVERGDYSAFGGMRTAIDGVNVGLAALSTTTRGFTGHEQLGSLDLIHMNGRIYDPSLGRFLQADPMVQDPGNPQNWNPHSYVFNNPLANTDPTGMFSVRQALGLIISVVAAVITQQYWFLENYGAAFASAAIGGFAAGVVSTGSLRQGLIGAFQSTLTLGIGGSDWSAVDKFIGNAFAGGIVSVLQGGKFGNGFASAGLTSLAMPLVGGNVVARSVEGALIGGTISDLTGGKFADGAISGAVQGAIQQGSKSTDDNDATVASGEGKESNVQTTINTDVLQSGYLTANEAATAAGVRFGKIGIDTQREFQVGIIKIADGNFGFTNSYWGAPSANVVNVQTAIDALTTRYGDNFVAWGHGHFDGNLKFSGIGLDYTFAKTRPLYLYNGKETRLLDNKIINKELFNNHANASNIYSVKNYIFVNRGFNGVCINGCGS